MYWPNELHKNQAKHTLPHRENDHQRKVNDFGSCIIHNMSGASLQTSINKDMTAFMGRYLWNIPATSSGTVTTKYIYRATTKRS
jgi:hypothetical protein